MKIFFIQFYLRIVQVFIGLLISMSVFSQDSLVQKESLYHKFINPDTTKAFRYKVLPAITYSPETRLGFGLGLIFNWNTKKASPTTNASLGQSFFMYTQNKQIEWTSKYEIFTNNNVFFLSGIIGYLKFPQYYFGVGNDLQEQNKENFTFQQFYFDIRVRYKLIPKIYVGIDYYFNTNYDVSWQEGSKFENDSTLYGTHGYLISGLGPEIAYDSRDFPFAPTKGAFYNLSMLVFSDVLGSEFKYNYYQLDLRQYIPINKKREWILAIQLYGLFGKGEVPFNRLPGLGGSSIMRGYYSGRFRDNNYLAFQMEWRMPIWKIISLRTWVGAGQVASSFNQFDWPGFKPNIGVGLRFQFDKRSRSNIRMDEGFGKNTQGFYFKINEAF